MEQILLIITTVASLLSATAGVISAARKRKVDRLTDDLSIANKRYESVKNELLRLYIDVQQLISIEEELCKKCGESKRSVRTGYSLDRLVEPARIKTRISELGN